MTVLRVVLAGPTSRQAGPDHSADNYPYQNSPSRRPGNDPDVVLDGHHRDGPCLLHGASYQRFWS